MAGVVRLAGEDRLTTLAATGSIGTEGRRVYLTELEAALGAPGRKGGIFHRNTALDESERFRRTLKRVRIQLDKAVHRKFKTSPDWEPDPDFATVIAKLATAQAAAVSTEEKLRKLTSADRKGYTPEQLEAVWKHQLLRAAQTMTDEEWATMLDVRFGVRVRKVMLPMLDVEGEWVDGDRKQASQPEVE